MMKRLWLFCRNRRLRRSAAAILLLAVLTPLLPMAAIAWDYYRDQQVREDRDGVLPLDDALEKLQFSQKFILPDNKLHS